MQDERIDKFVPAAGTTAPYDRTVVVRCVGSRNILLYSIEVGYTYVMPSVPLVEVVVGPRPQ
eukprot:scaffold25615_cov57-Attheya_sp.AAC.1